MIPESEVPKKRSVKEQTSICTPGARNASKSKIVEACLRSNCPVARREMLQSARLGGCNRSEPEMRCVWQFAFGCEDYHSYIIRMIERPQQALFNRMCFFFVTMSYRITSLLNYMLYIMFVYYHSEVQGFCGFKLHRFTDQQAPPIHVAIACHCQGEAWFSRPVRRHWRFAKAAGSEQSAYLRNPVLIPFSRDDVLPPKQSAKHWFVCSLLQVLV